MSSRSTMVSRVRLGALLLVAVALVATCFTILNGRGEEDGMTLKVRVADASPLLPGNDVRSNGVRVGTIRTIEVVDGGRSAEMILDLDDDAMPIHDDAFVKTRPVSILGEQYLDLNRGSVDSPVVSDGDSISEDREGPSVGLDQVLNTLDAPTSASLGLLVNALGVGMDGNGANTRDALKALLPAVNDTRGLVGVLDEQTDVIEHLLQTLAPVAEAVGTEDGAQLDRLVRSSQALLASTSQRDDALRAMIQELPSTLSAAQTTLAKLAGTAGEATPTLEALRPTTSDLTQISRELSDFAGAADPALKSSVPVLERAQDLLDEAAPVAAQLRAAGPALRASAISADPLTQKLASDMDSVMGFFKGWALTTNGRDGLSHYFRAGLIFTAQAATGLLPDLSTTTDKKDQRKGPLKDLKSSLDDTVDQLLGGAKDALDGLAGLLSPRTDKSGGVTGLTQRQESGALAFLLGGN